MKKREKVKYFMLYFILLPIIIFLMLYLFHPSLFPINLGTIVLLIFLYFFIFIGNVIIIPVGLSILTLFIYFFIFIINSPIFKADVYKNLVGVKYIKAKDILEDDFLKVRKVNREMAWQKCNKIIGKKYKGYPISTFYYLPKELGRVVKVKDNLYWVFPLDYNGFFKWTKRNVIPGYVMISATNPQDTPKLIKKEIKLSPYSFFNTNLNRFIAFKTKFNMTDYHFEVDDNLNPYWIISIYKWNIFFHVKKVKKIMVINASTKEYKFYDNNHIPVWIDKTIEEDTAEPYLTSYSKYQKGFWYYLTVDVPEPTKYENNEFWFILTKKGLKWFTGMTSSNNKDNSLVYAVLLSPHFYKDRKPVLYIINDINGVTDENGAVKAVVSKLGSDIINWRPVLPQPFIINNKFFWTLSIVSKNNYYQKTAFVEGKNITNVYFSDINSFRFDIIKRKKKNLDLRNNNLNLDRKQIIEQIRMKLREINNLLKLLD